MSRITSIFFKENRKNSVSKSENPGHIGSLDGIRGVAILMVFAEHYGDIAEHTHSAPLLFIQHLKSTGWLGVDLFFALSGYLITGILWKTRSDKNRARNFYAKRVLRLFPVYYGVWFFLLCYSAITSIDWNPRVFLEYLLYAGNFAAPYHINIGPFQIVHFWSLAVEEQFYLIWPLLLWNMPSKKSAMRLLAALFSASVLIKIAYLLLHVNNHAYHYLPTHMEAIASGSFIALANVERAEVWQRYAKLGLVISLPALMIAFAIFHGLNMTKLPVLIVAFPLVAIAASSLILRSQNPDSFLS